MAKQTKRENRTRGGILRMTISDDYSHRELHSMKFRKKNAIILAVTTCILLLAAGYFLASRTPLKYTIPGYPSAKTKAIAIENRLKIDSLERVIDMWAFQLANIQRVTAGKDPVDLELAVEAQQEQGGQGLSAGVSADDSLLREQIKKEEQFNLTFSHNTITQIEGMHFYPPVKGIITEEYNPSAGHPYIDISAPVNTAVAATLDGSVISAGWRDDTGYTIEIQHDNNIISVYKHNEKLLKKVGDKVTAGTPIALLGNTGSLSTGAHLHFELWHKGEAIDPTQYITF